MPLFPHQKNNDNLEAAFSRFLAPVGGPRPCKIKPKRCKGVQKRGSHLFSKNLDFITNCIKNDLPCDPPNRTKPQKIHKIAHPKTNLENASNKPLKINLS